MTKTQTPTLEHRYERHFTSCISVYLCVASSLSEKAHVWEQRIRQFDGSSQTNDRKKERTHQRQGGETRHNTANKKDLWRCGVSHTAREEKDVKTGDSNQCVYDISNHLTYNMAKTSSLDNTNRCVRGVRAHFDASFTHITCVTYTTVSLSHITYITRNNTTRILRNA